MKLKHLSLIVFLIAWVGISGMALYNLSLRPTLPVDVEETGNSIFLVTPDSGLQEIAYAADQPVSRRYEINDIVELMNIGDTLNLRTANGAEVQYTLQ